jgi:hypothetical protein
MEECVVVERVLLLKHKAELKQSDRKPNSTITNENTTAVISARFVV